MLQIVREGSLVIHLQLAVPAHWNVIRKDAPIFVLGQWQSALSVQVVLQLFRQVSWFLTNYLTAVAVLLCNSFVQLVHHLIRWVKLDLALGLGTIFCSAHCLYM